CYGFDRWMIVVSALLTLARFSAVEEPARATLVFMAMCDVCLLGTFRRALEVAVVARLGTALGVAALLVENLRAAFVQQHVGGPSALGGLDGGCALLGSRLFDSFALLAVERRAVLVAGAWADAAGVNVHSRHAIVLGILRYRSGHRLHRQDDRFPGRFQGQSP